MNQGSDVAMRTTRSKHSQDSVGDYGGGTHRNNPSNSIWSKKQGSTQEKSGGNNQSKNGPGQVFTAQSPQRSNIVDQEDKKLSCVSQSIQLADRSKTRPKPAVSKRRQKKAVLLVEFEFGVPSPR